ncbi:MAG TPA: succinate dehydrogenase/fumarate reductase cytochrome b subunit [Humidesulfovibrio sp.]|uniref:succinate dehydrogenase/fumarate reductase cytochrome b subunit n=1 Tax=Humidesulfovibrio sp. TaxID=2910988 RepID=UPI002BE108E3|nr:succinate dehydrogenase/fumarate reductase cytochrome b subunit [Humidesulfovibrio sp.]HWR05109.1 succinate dehydrogenase/fumarate reductase cytochrome b subunit [Humidesulfovibrio sp.]
MSLPLTANHPTLNARRLDGVLDWAQMLSGAGLISFMWAHMMLVASVVISPDVMNAIAEFFEKTGMAQVGGPLIFLLFLAHFVLAARKIPFRLEGQKTIWEHAKMLHHTDTWLWVVQAVSAMVILVMGAIHMWVVLSDLPITAIKSAERIRSGAWILFYLVLLPMVELHVGIGFYRILVKWGFVQRSGRKGLKRGENLLTLIMVSIGVLTLIRFWFLKG